MADAQTFRQAWGKFATGVSIITTVEPDGHVHGMAANGIASVSLDPLLVLLCVGHNRNSYLLVKESRRFAISILSEGQRPIAEYYARRPDDRTGDVEVSFSFTGSGGAVVEDCLASMDCHVVSHHEAGDHTIFIAAVDEIDVRSGKPLIFFEGSYGRLG